MNDKKDSFQNKIDWVVEEVIKILLFLVIAKAILTVLVFVGFVFLIGMLDTHHLPWPFG